jgi:hypothetical protein
MVFIKYSVVELGLEEDMPGWVKQAKEAKAAGTDVDSAKTEETPANKKAEEQEGSSIKDQ